MFHAHISFYLNCGLLLPLECVCAAEKAYYDGLENLFRYFLNTEKEQAKV